MHGASPDLSINPWIAGGILIFSLLLSAFFSGAETALTAASRARMHSYESSGDLRAGIVTRLLNMRERFIGAMLLGNQLVNIAASAFTTSVLVTLAGENGVIYATIIMTVLVVVFAEVLPKTIAINYPDKSSLFIARFAAFFVAIFGPVLIAVEILVRSFLRLFGMKLGENTSILSAREELRDQVDFLHKEGSVVKTDRDMLGGLLDLQELGVSDVMVHRTKMRTIDAELPSNEIVREVLSSPYTRLPLWRERPDNIIGVLHAKDLLRALEAAGGDTTKLDVEDLALPAWFVPDTTSLSDQLKAFLKRKTHFAVVVDEYGEVMGLVTLEDILEEIVGDIKDEHDTSVTGVRPQADGSYNVDGSVPIRDLNRALDWNLPDDEATTIAGLVIHEARVIPEAGQSFNFYGFRFQVLRKTRNRITAIRIAPLPKEA
ncbi:MAG: HlyC/CorC family transporter [Beijerinckiaceae bacterium]|nr:HlyC/CorC family transporter [Beijerinckiaceae bacterium]